MSLWSRLLGARESAAPAAPPQPPPDLQPQAALGSWSGTLVHTSAELEQVLRGGRRGPSGASPLSKETGITNF